jgi:hypothetical protein
MSEKKKQDPISYLIKWSGYIFMTLISSFGYGGTELYFKGEPTCRSEAAELVRMCRNSADTDTIMCMGKAEALFKVCNDGEPREE